MSYDLGGFSITSSTITTMIIIFALYSLLIVGLGAYVKIQSKRGGTDTLSSFLTGGGGLSAFAIAMIAATNSMAGGVMVTAPGLTYAIGFSGAVIYFGGFLTAAYGIGSIGRKAAILRARTNAVSYLQLLRLRFQSKGVVAVLAITGVIGLTMTAAAQITAGAKVFAAVTGSNAYYFGLLLVIIITTIYTITGGIKSLAKVAVIQGVVMLCAVFSIVGILLFNNAQTFGSLTLAIQELAETFPAALRADTGFSFLKATGTAIYVSVGLCAIPSTLSVSMTYNNSRALKRGVIISCVIFLCCQGLMDWTGTWARILNPNLVTRDYVTIYTATNMLPSWLAGIIFCGIFAAIQSSIAGYCMAGAAHIAKDFIIDCYHPDMPQKKQANLNLYFVIGIAAVATIIAIWPTDLTQYMINFSLGSLAASWYWPALLGLYWKKATKSGMIASTVSGFVVYMLLYFVTRVIPATKAWWVNSMGNLEPFVVAWVVAFLCMYFVSKATLKKEKVPLGYYQVFFCDEYDEKYAVIAANK